MADLRPDGDGSNEGGLTELMRNHYHICNSFDVAADMSDKNHWVEHDV